MNSGENLEFASRKCVKQFDTMAYVPYLLFMKLHESDIIDAIESYSKRSGIAASTFCFRAVNDGKTIKKLRAGGTITLRRVRKIFEYMEAHPVDGNEASPDAA